MRTQNAMEDCAKRDLERAGGEWRTTAKDKDREEAKEEEMTVTMAILTREASDNKGITIGAIFL